MGWEPEIREGDEPCTLLVAGLDMAIDDRVSDFFVRKPEPDPCAAPA